MNETTIYLIRHGKTFANEQRLYCGSTDLGLSESGKEELQQLKKAGVYQEIPSSVSWFCSPMERAKQTLLLLFPESEVVYQVWLGLEECRFGRFEMHSYEQLKEDPEYIRWILDESGLVACPGGESREANRCRVLESFQRLCQHLEFYKLSNAGVICHGGTIVTIMEHLCPGEKNFYEWQPAPGRGYRLKLQIEGEKKTVISLQKI